jgi:hypothetical protein
MKLLTYLLKYSKPTPPDIAEAINKYFWESKP